MLVWVVVSVSVAVVAVVMRKLSEDGSIQWNILYADPGYGRGVPFSALNFSG